MLNCINKFGVDYMKKLLLAAVMGVMMIAGCSSSSSASPSSASASASGSESASSASGSASSSSSEEVSADEAALKEKLFTDGTSFPQLEEPKKGEEIAILKTNMGDIKIKFCPEQAPKAVENFVTHAKEGYYDNLTFHRVINDFMIQGGDPEGNGTGGTSIWGDKFEDEFSGDMYHFRGALAMANSGADTNGSQFYIVQKPEVTDGYFSDYVQKVIDQYGADKVLYNSQTGKIFRTNYSDEAQKKYESLGGTPELDFGYTVFGQVFEGMDVVDAIAKTETDDKDKPKTDVVIEKIEITQY